MAGPRIHDPLISCSLFAAGPVLDSEDVNEAYLLIKDLEPTTPQEYILKGVVNAALGQEQGSVCYTSPPFHILMAQPRQIKDRN